MSDLRATGVHEQAADVILALYRESYYDPTCPNPNLLEVAILKNRMGPTTSEPIQLWYEKETQSFRDANVARKPIEEML
jgi:replicative DNA helicase